MLSRGSATTAQLLRSATATATAGPIIPGGARAAYATIQSDIFKPTKFGGKYTVTLIPGDGIGAEVAESVKTIFKADNPGCRHVGLDIKGKDQANPTALILSGSMLLRHLGLDDHANRISQAVYAVIADGKVRTRDMGGESTTHEFTRAILDKMETL
ncbi:hypothetical protein BN1708_015830 [Verticillium longisporum]|uniref:Isopropylmalate dehydrogenase-like domain-containing protein n=1 Tax=Verticillium longisporum TaxID=100787 RepID=A0A0G4M8R6_VERLO|nr:hypothetical protein BN1708_015830 [Verticillium longisporum]